MHNQEYIESLKRLHLKLKEAVSWVENHSEYSVAYGILEDAIKHEVSSFRASSKKKQLKQNR